MKWIFLFLLTLSFSVSGEDSETCDSSYPPEAAAASIEGFVQMAYDVNIEGQPVNIAIIKSELSGVFDEAAVCSLTKWKYNPQFKDGTAVEQSGLKVQLDFALEKHGN